MCVIVFYLCNWAFPRRNAIQDEMTSSLVVDVVSVAVDFLAASQKFFDNHIQTLSSDFNLLSVASLLRPLWK